MESKKEELIVQMNLGQDRNKCTGIENGLEDMGRWRGQLGKSEKVTLAYIHYQM